MRLKIVFKGDNVVIPSNTQHLVNSYIHKCLGRNNEYHDAKSNYSVSTLQNGILDVDNHTITVDGEVYIVVSSLDSEFNNKLIVGALSNNTFYPGITLHSFMPIEEKFHNGWNYFRTLTPMLIKGQGRGEYITISNTEKEEFTAIVKNHLLRKLSKVDSTLDLSNFDIRIIWCYERTVWVKNVRNQANLCQIDIHTNKRVAETLYNLGIGQSTGSGFGTIYKKENLGIYRKVDVLSDVSEFM